MRVRFVQVQPQLFVEMMMNGIPRPVQVVKDSLPPGTRYVEARIMWEHPEKLHLLVEHPSFDDIGDAGIIPFHPPPMLSISVEAPVALS